MRFIRFLLIICAAISTLNCYAQFTVTGKILSRADGKPVIDASVFLSNATIGGKTENDGTFVLRGVKPGKYKLAISAIGFEIYYQEFIINNSNITLPDVRLFLKTIALKEVKIKYDHKKDKYGDWAYETFKKEFLGTSDLAGDCKILNPEILNLDYDETTNVLTASSPDFLEIENDALGYKIKYLLTDFELNNGNPAAKEIHYEGSVLFAEMKGTPAQERRWQQRRQEVYEGSEMHFFRSVLNGQAEEEGFRILRLATYANPRRPPDSLIEAKIKRFKVTQFDRTQAFVDSLSFWKKQSKLPKILRTLFPFPLDKEDLVAGTDQSSIFTLGCSTDELLVIYNKDHRFPQASQLGDLNNLSYNVNKSTNKELTLLDIDVPYTSFDKNGGVTNPNSLVLKGAWMRNRIAELLPIDYEVPQNKNINAIVPSKNDTLLANVATKLNTYSAAHPVEKVYLHLNKPYYNIGDTIWYKAYTVSSNNRLSKLSGVLQVELINPGDSVSIRQTLKLTGGVGWSEFSLPRNISRGTYHIRAYTNWMRNQGPAYFYDHRLEIGGQMAKITSKAPLPERPDVQFFPEGGEMVNGVRSRIAFKAINNEGVGEDVKGTIEDNEGNTVADFSSSHLGMGVFALMPQPGKTYHAKVITQGEASFTVNLPPAMESGLALSVDNREKDSIYVKITANDKLFEASQNSTFYLVAQSQGKLYYTTEGKLSNPVFMARIARSRLPSGIVQFTLFSQSGEPLNERVAFVLNDDTLKMKLTGISGTYTPRQKINMGIESNTGEAAGLTGSYSISVINENRVPSDEGVESTIMNDLLLTSDLKGYIEQPNYYFTNVNEQKKADLDLLMLTQGYRKFEWKDILGNKPASIAYQPQQGVPLQGVLKTSSGKPVPHGKITFAATRQGMVTDTTTDINGNFNFGDFDLPDTANVVLRARTERNSSGVAIYIKQPEYPAIAKTAGENPFRAEMANLKLTPEMEKNLKDYHAAQKQDSLRKGRQLKQVNITAKKTPRPDASNLYGTDSPYTISGEKLSQYGTLMQGLQLFLPHALYVNGQFTQAKPPFGAYHVVINDRPTTQSEISSYRPEEIENVKILEGGAYKTLLGVTGTLKGYQTTGAGNDDGIYIIYITTKAYAGTDTVKAIKLKQVNIQAKQSHGPDLSHSDNLNGPGHANFVIMGDQLSGCTTLYDCLVGKMPGTMVAGGKFYLIRNLARDKAVHPDAHQNSDNPMAVFIDGMEFSQKSDSNPLTDLNTSDIASIEVLTSGAYLAMYGSHAAGGALIITTRRGDNISGNYQTSTQPAGLIAFHFNGYHVAKTFYSPKYDHPKTETEPFDFRSAIYWNPNVTIDDKGKANISWFNADAKGTYRIVVEGINDDGNVGRVVYRYKVE